MTRNHIFLYLLYILVGFLGSAIVAWAWTNPSAAPPSGDPGPVPISRGGTTATTSTPARTNLGAAASGANSDIASLSGLTTALSTSQGGIGSILTISKGDLLIGINSGGAFTRLATSTNGYVLTASSTATHGISWEAGGGGGGGGGGWTDDGTVVRLTTITDSVGIGTASPAMKAEFAVNTPSNGILISGYGAGTEGTTVNIAKSRNAVIGSHTIVQNGDELGGLFFRGSDGSVFNYGAYINSKVDGTPAAGSIPANLIFATRTAGGTDATERMRITSSGNVGIGTTPGYKLDVISGGATTARFGTVSTDTVIVGGGAGKLDTGTVDPIYTIGGERYATYLSGMTGVKEETTGIAVLDGGKYEIDIAKAPKGSDIWLFYQITDFGKDWENLGVLVTPSFEGRVWYKKYPTDGKLIIYGDKSGELSYRLTAPRFDYRNWTNLASPDDSVTGFIVLPK